MDRKPKAIIATDTGLHIWVAKALESSGSFEVIFITDDGAECIAAASRFKPDLIVLGIGLRTLNGLEVVRCIKIEHQTIRCLVLNEYTALCAQLFSAGADACILLPCTRKAILQSAESLVLTPAM